MAKKKGLEVGAIDKQNTVESPSVASFGMQERGKEATAFQDGRRPHTGGRRRRLPGSKPAGSIEISYGKDSPLASEAGAQTVLGYRQGRKYVELEKYRGQTITFTANRVIHWINEIKPDATVIDASGLGIGVVDTCKQLGYEVQAFNGGEAAFDSRKYGNRRAETWGLGKLWLEAGAEIPDDEHLASQITGPHYYYRKGQSLHGALMIEPKENMARRGLASPDRADTLMLTHAVDPAPKETQTNEGPARRPTNWMSV